MTGVTALSLSVDDRHRNFSSESFCASQDDANNWRGPATEEPVCRMERIPPQQVRLRAMSTEAARLSVDPPLSKSLMYELISTGKLPSIKVGRRRLITVEAFERLITQGIK